MCDVCDGDLLSEDRDSFIYKTDRLNGELKMVNLSTGMKSFVILRRLLQNEILMKMELLFWMSQKFISIQSGN